MSQVTVDKQEISFNGNCYRRCALYIPTVTIVTGIANTWKPKCKLFLRFNSVYVVNSGAWRLI